MIFIRQHVITVISENVEENREGIEYSANVYNNFLIKYDLISLNGKYTKK